jgi:hypothetical protein
MQSRFRAEGRYSAVLSHRFGGEGKGGLASGEAQFQSRVGWAKRSVPTRNVYPTTSQPWARR